MSVSSALTGELALLRERRDRLQRMLDESLSRAQRSGRDDLDPRERSMLSEFRQLQGRVKRAESELARAGDPHVGGATRGRGTAINTAGQLAPLAFSDQELRRLQAAAMRGEHCRIETRSPGFSTADPLLPATRFPFPVEAIHESRLLNRLPGYAIETPAITFIRHISTSGEAAAVAEGDLKPELIFETDALTATAVKLAANNGLSWEVINDWPAFRSYCGAELYRRVIDIENYQLLQSGLTFAGSPPSEPFPGMVGFLATPGVLRYDASVDTGGSGSSLLTAFDAIEKSIAELRVGPALATPDLLVLHPTTWSSIRRVKDSYGRFMAQPDPTADQANEVFNIPVLQTTQMVIGQGLLLDTSKLGYVAIREPLSMRIGYTNDDFSRNILRTVAEERLVLAVTRPPACLVISNLPTS
ncbi:phage major capsid protein [Mycobacterium sp. E787]|uniref:phage major capsid protein n=1 Tax=Mycobacterium sp. E787 TaxID=1834150 RepID=UPI000AB5533B|nr:phage major capsid protein [Mycobacterium sp. E787]